MAARTIPVATRVRSPAESFENTRGGTSQNSVAPATTRRLIDANVAVADVAEGLATRGRSRSRCPLHEPREPGGL
jgi:hypothetical protein